jgi:hypothetical protein
MRRRDNPKLPESIARITSASSAMGIRNPRRFRIDLQKRTCTDSNECLHRCYNPAHPESTSPTFFSGQSQLRLALLRLGKLQVCLYVNFLKQMKRGIGDMYIIAGINARRTCADPDIF